MKIRKAISAIALFVLLVAPVAARQNKSQTQPKSGNATSAAPLMVIDSFAHDFGEVKAGSPLRYAFKIKNQGTADLLINSVSPG